MNFKTSFWKLTKHWVFDDETFIGYKVTLDKEGVPCDYVKAFVIEKDANGSHECTRKMSVPVGVIKKAIKIVENKGNE